MLTLYFPANKSNARHININASSTIKIESSHDKPIYDSESGFNNEKITIEYMEILQILLACAVTSVFTKYFSLNFISHVLM